MKIKLLGMGTSENKVYLKLRNNDSARALLSYFPLKTGFEAEHEAFEHAREKNRKGTDIRSSWGNDNFEIDVIFGNRVAFFIIRTKTIQKLKYLRSIIREVVPFEK